ncbi:p24 [Peridroma alphabaculovirus]|uniref:p24 n=1 Tax=Peridroma alphabaculovirus TaxID=1346829 RepID=A0A068LKD0_9ABAC|nr:p24 [Peridroma alphabaculovirus]AIE47742.1 p24 [Peridroma alphabaculovirus]
MYESNMSAGSSAPSVHFNYDDQQIEVVIIENGDDDRDGYVELSAAARLLAPLVSIRGFNQAVMWANVIPSHKLSRNGKNYVHAFALGRYLSSYRLATDKPPAPELHVLKQMFCDLIMGAQSQVIDPLADIKTQLCTLQDCIVSGNGNAIYQSSSSSSSGNGAAAYDSGQQEAWRETLRSENLSLFSNINAVLETIRNMQVDLTNKLAFSNDTMLDGFKSIKDLINRKKQ